MGILDILVAYHREFASGLLVTIQLCLLIWPIGIACGTALGIAGAKWSVVGTPSQIVSFGLSGMPVIVFLFWLHYPLQYMLDIVIRPFYTATAALSLINAFMVADLVRTTLKDFPNQYVMAARVCGLSHRDTVLKIQLPIVIRQILPGLLLIEVAMLQATLFASLISVEEVFRVAQRINSEIYRPIEIYTALAILFLAVCLPMHWLAHVLKVRYTRDDSEH